MNPFSHLFTVFFLGGIPRKDAFLIVNDESSHNVTVQWMEQRKAVTPTEPATQMEDSIQDRAVGRHQWPTIPTTTKGAGSRRWPAVNCQFQKWRTRIRQPSAGSCCQCCNRAVSSIQVSLTLSEPVPAKVWPLESYLTFTQYVATSRRKSSSPSSQQLFSRLTQN